ncbi:MAG: clostripain-related cysteine peptidase [Planctomycetota bacterium]
MKSLFVAVALSAMAPWVRGQDPPRAFRFPTPALSGTFADMLGDELRLDPGAGRMRATGKLGGRAASVDAALLDGGFRGTAKLDGDEQPCSGALAEETLTVHIGESEWRLRPEADLLPALAELGAPEPDANRNWTVAIYLGGDNDLEGAAIRDLLEMQRGMPAAGCEVVVLIDRHKDDDDGEDEWSDTRVLRVRPGTGGTFDNLATPGELDTSSASTLASFATGVFRRYPAKHHALVVWDHGGGFTGICIDEDAPGRPAGKRMLSLMDVRRGIATALQRACLLRLDLVAFDACLMAQLDVALAMSDLADTMVASEATVPGSGYPYTQVLPKFADDRSGRDVGREIVGQYGSFSDDAFESGSTLVALDLRKAASVAAGLDGLAHAALGACDAQWRAVARALFYAECYQPRQDRVGDRAACSIDLVDLTSRLRGIPGIGDDVLDSLQLRIAAMVLDRYSGAERTLSWGVSIYGPHRNGQYDADYDPMPLALGNAWRPLLRRVHALADGDDAELTVGDFRQVDAMGQPSGEATPFGGHRLLFTATGGSIVEVKVRDWQYEADGNRWLLLRARLVTDPLWPARWAKAAAADMIDLVMPQFQEGRNELFHEIDGLTFSITDGALQAYGSLDMAAASTQAPIAAIARCTPKATGKPLIVEVAFDRAEWNTVDVRPVVALDGGVLPRALVPAPGDTFEFWLLTRDAEGKETGIFTPALTWGAQGLTLVPEPDEPGRYRAEMIARTIQGRTAAAVHEYTLAANPDLAAWPKSWEGFDPAALVGTWAQFRVSGPQQYQDLKTTCEVTATTATNLFTVLCKGGPSGDDYETHPLWFFEWRGLPCLRIVTHIADGQKFGWYGPVRIDQKGGKLVLAMKAVNASGVVWEWRKQ